MIRHSLGLRLDPDRSARDQIHESARLGAAVSSSRRSATLHRTGWARPAGASCGIS